MATFQAPPGHLSQAEVLILSRMVQAKLTVEAPDPDLKVERDSFSSETPAPPRVRCALAVCAAACERRAVACMHSRACPHAAAVPEPQAPQLTTAEGHKVVGTMAVARAGEWGRNARRNRCTAAAATSIAPR